MRRFVLSSQLGLCLLAGFVLSGCRQAPKPLPPTLTIATVSDQEQLPIESGVPIVAAQPPQAADSLPIATRNGPAQPVPPVPISPAPVREPVRSAPTPEAAQPRLPEPVQTQPKAAPRWSGSHHSQHLWLVGVLERGPDVGTWVLHYARPEENDRYGGRLLLVSPSMIVGYRPGQVLRVEGHVVVDILQTAYQVERIEVVSQPDPEPVSTVPPKASADPGDGSAKYLNWFPGF